MWGILLLGNPFHMSNSTSYLLYLQQQKENTKTTHLGKPGGKNILSEYSFLKSRLAYLLGRTTIKKVRRRANRSEPLISCVSLY